jgi:hypothetical protein
VRSLTGLRNFNAFCPPLGRPVSIKGFHAGIVCPTLRIAVKSFSRLTFCFLLISGLAGAQPAAPYQAPRSLIDAVKKFQAIQVQKADDELWAEFEAACNRLPAEVRHLTVVSLGKIDPRRTDLTECAAIIDRGLARPGSPANYAGVLTVLVSYMEHLKSLQAEYATVHEKLEPLLHQSPGTVPGDFDRAWEEWDRTSFDAEIATRTLAHELGLAIVTSLMTPEKF